MREVSREEPQARKDIEKPTKRAEAAEAGAAAMREAPLKRGHVECGWCSWTGPEREAYWAWEWWMCRTCWMEMEQS